MDFRMKFLIAILLTVCSALAANPKVAGGLSVVLETNGTHYVTATGSTTARSVQDRFAEVKSILDFGAVGDGTTDDTTALQLAFNAVASDSGGAVFIPARTFIINTVKITNSHVRIFGQNATSAILRHRMSVAPTGPMLNFIGNTTIQFDGGLTLDGNKQATYAANSAVHANSKLIHIATPSTAQRILIEGINTVNQIADGVYFEGTPVVTVIRGCVFKDGYEYADDTDVVNNPNGHNSSYVNFNLQGTFASPLLVVENSYFGSATTPAATTHFPAGLTVAGSQANSTYPTGTIQNNKFENIPGWNLYKHAKGFRVISNTHTNSTRYAGRINTPYGVVVAFNTATGIRSDATEMYLFDAVEHGAGEEGNTAMFFANNITGSALTTVPAIRIARGGNYVQVLYNTITNVAKAVHYNGGAVDSGAYVKIDGNIIHSTATPSDNTATIHLENSLADFHLDHNIIQTDSAHGIYSLGSMTGARVFIGDNNSVSTDSSHIPLVSGGLKHYKFGGKLNRAGGGAISSIASGAVITNLVFGKVESLSGGALAINWANIVSASGDVTYSGTPEGTVPAPIGTTFRRSDGGSSTTFYAKESGTGTTGWTAYARATHTHAISDVTSLQSTLDGKVDESAGAATNLTVNGVQHVGAQTNTLATASRVAIFDSAKRLTNSAAVDTTELEYLDGVTSSIQTQLDNKQPLDGDLTTIANNNPGNSYYFGTDAGGSKGFYTFPSAATITNYATFAMSDLTTTLTSGGNKNYWRPPYAIRIVSIKASVLTASSAGAITIDVEEGGTTIFSTALTIDASENDSSTAAAAAVISDTDIAANAEMTFDLDGAGANAAGLQVTFAFIRI